MPSACADLLEDPGVHAVMVILPPPPMYTAGAVAKAVIPVIHSAEKPVVFALMGERLIQEAVEHLRAARRSGVSLPRASRFCPGCAGKARRIPGNGRPGHAKSAVKAPESARAPSSPSARLRLTNRVPGCRFKPWSGSWRRMASAPRPVDWRRQPGRPPIWQTRSAFRLR